MTELISTTSRVQAPHITVKIGEYSFGLYSKKKAQVESNGKYYTSIKTTYPNYLQSLTVKKINGAFNTYTLVMNYGITANSDPNMLEKVFSSVSQSRKIVFTYGDCAVPTYMYKEEEAIITKISSQISATAPQIIYTVSAVSTAIKSTAGKFNFIGYNHKKPSERIYELLKNKNYGLQEIFYGMHDISQVKQLGLIRQDDKEVVLEAKKNMTPWDYLQYLVSCMTPEAEKPTYIGWRKVRPTQSLIKSGKYSLVVHDDVTDVLDGPYFTVEEMETSLPEKTSVDYYTIDVGYPGKDFVANFTVIDDESYSILYNYSQEVQQSDHVYRIGDDGNVNQIFSPTISNSSELLKTTEADKNWWTTLTQFPIKATLQIRGLLRAMLLMTYIKINVYYYGKKHISSGIYIVTAEEDTVNETGYFTTLSLTRIKGDSDVN